MGFQTMHQLADLFVERYFRWTTLFAPLEDTSITDIRNMVMIWTGYVGKMGCIYLRNIYRFCCCCLFVLLVVCACALFFLYLIPKDNFGIASLFGQLFCIGEICAMLGSSWFVGSQGELLRGHIFKLRGQ